MSATTVDGRRAIRVSVSNWQTSDTDIYRALEAFRDAERSTGSSTTRSSTMR
jgi:hypothetical protein